MTLSKSTVDNNQAKGDGGLFLLQGTGSMSLLIDSVTLSNSISKSGHGGVASLKGQSTSIIV